MIDTRTETIPPHIARVLELLTKQYPEYGRDLTVDQLRDQMRLYALLLRDIEPTILEAAAVHYIANNKWFPKVSELREAALSLITHNELSAEEAWGEVKTLIRRYGSYGTPECPHDLVMRAIKIIGWRELCASENEVADRAHFFKIFQSLIERRNRTTMMLPELRELTQALSASSRNQLKAAQK